jgi:hypothetical protein
MLFNVYLHDLMTCHKVMRTDVFKSLPPPRPGIRDRARDHRASPPKGERIFELPVRYKARRTEEGKKLTARDGVRVIATLVRCRLT